MEKFSLKWNDFSSNVHKSFQNLRKEEDFFDITLVGDDFKHVTAHKLVLSSSSEYFKMVLSNNKKYFQSHATICLVGLNQNDLNNVLDYIYHGELQLYQDDLERFLGIADKLKLEGLIRGDQFKDEKDGKAENSLEEKVLTPDSKLFESCSPDSKMKKKLNKTTEKHVISVQQSSDIQSFGDLDQKVEESYSRDSNGFFACHHCEKSFKQIGHIKEHVERHFEGLCLPCTMCDAILNSRPKLRDHLRRKHRDL